MAKSGYNDEEFLEKRKVPSSISISEQETVVLYMRDEDFATIYTSDSTQMTRLDKLCVNSPDLYVLIEDTGIGKKYKCHDKDLISFRKKKRELTDEQKEAAGERMRKYQTSKRS